MKRVKIGEFLIRVKDTIDIYDDLEYMRITIKTKNKGISLRDCVKGCNIGTKKQFRVKSNQFLVSKIDALNGAFGIIAENLDGGIITGNFWTFNVNTDLVNIRWFNLFVSQPSFIETCNQLSSGTTNRRYLDEKKFSEFMLDLPSLQEQELIISNFNEIKNITDTGNLELNRQLSYITSLRQAILQQAVEGNLCEQVETDEPANLLLEKIKAEKEQLIKDKKIKQDKMLTLITDEEKPFELSKGWAWVKLGPVAFVTKLAGFEYTDYFDLQPTGEIPVIRAQNVKMNRVDYTNLLYIDKATSHLLQRSSLDKKCILITFIGAGIGDVAFFDNDQRYHLAPNVAKLELYSNKILYKYLMYYLMSPTGKKQILKYQKATAQPSLSMQTIREIIMPIPPLAEQKRIVEKVDELMSLCDELEKEVKTAKEWAEQLMGAVLQEAFKVS